jgi:ATP-binding cassette, subfamily B, heavy metal transporter
MAPEGRPLPSLSRASKFVRPYLVPRTRRLRLLGLFSVLCTVLQKAVDLLPSLATKVLVDALVASDARRAVTAAVAFFAFRQLGTALGVAKAVSHERIAQTVARQFATRTFEAIQMQSFAYHLQTSAGVSSAVLRRGTSAVTTLLNVVCLELGPTALEALCVIAAFFHIGAPAIALTTGATAAVYIAYTGFMTRRRALLNRELVHVQNCASKHAIETLSECETVKMFASEGREVDRDDALRASVQTLAGESKWVITCIVNCQGMIMHTGITAGMLLAAADAAAGRITPGDFVLSQALISQLLAPLQWLGNSYGRIIDSLTDLEQVMDVHDAKLTVKDAPDAAELRKDADAIARGAFGDIEFDDVSFHYVHAETGATSGVSNVSFRVRPGTMTALCGRSGSGKSTCMRLTLRLFDPDSGVVRLDGVDVRRYTQESLRACIGVVAQDTVLFDDTLRYNASYGNPEASEDEVWRALRAAALEPYVKRQPLGLDTVAGPRGVTMSGGERQRLGAARCILKNPGVILLDEATSALDSRTEQAIRRNLEDAFRHRTTIVVAHRLSTIAGADQILVFDGGRIIERGTHRELLSRRDGAYAEMWRLQRAGAPSPGKGQYPAE